MLLVKRKVKKREAGSKVEEHKRGPAAHASSECRFSDWSGGGSGMGTPSGRGSKATLNRPLLVVETGDIVV